MRFISYVAMSMAALLSLTIAAPTLGSINVHEAPDITEVITPPADIAA